MVRILERGYLKSNLSQAIKAFKCADCGSVVFRRIGIGGTALCNDCASVCKYNDVRIPWMK